MKTIELCNHKAKRGTLIAKKYGYPIMFVMWMAIVGMTCSVITTEEMNQPTVKDFRLINAIEKSNKKRNFALCQYSNATVNTESETVLASTSRKHQPKEH